ncbi:type II secretion system F family protein [Nocardioides jensenii]|uniref:type II secretion system F family protein n=1 Tax=Nocardioides jensenii TaxID=1843 RepID=UPI0008326D66|nr:type II secretion system F family protein [Nocardioides jensenii]
MSALFAAGLAGVAVCLLRPLPRRARPPSVLWAVCGVVAPGAYAALGGLSWRVAAPAAILGAAVFGLLLLRTRRRRSVAAAATGARIQEVCELVGGELAAGLPADRCLDEAAHVWPPFAAVVSAHALGGSVPDALRELSGRPGAGDLRLVASAWQVAVRSGSGPAVALAEVAETVREREATRRLVRTELASARSTARLMAGLPVLTLVMGSGAGGDPVRFLLSTPLGLACLAAGVLLTVAGLCWIEAIAAGVEASA